MQAPEKAEWTILVYIAAHNNLDALGQRSLDQILGVGSTPAVRLAVFFDGASRAARYIVGESGGAQVEEQLSDVDSADPEVLLKTARWAFGQLPAEHYGLVLWSHGSGWRPEEIQEVARQVRGDSQVDVQESIERAEAPGSQALFRTTFAQILRHDRPAERAILFDDGSGHALDTLELARVTDEIQRAIKQPLDLLGMDACLMATLEVAYQLHETTRYVIASEELVPGHSWPYDLILGELRANPRLSAKDVAVSIVRRYVEYYTGHPPSAGDVTGVAVDLSGMAALADAVGALGNSLIAHMDSQADLLWQAQLACYTKESQGRRRDPNKFRYHLWDARSLAMQLAATTSSSEVKIAAQDVVAALEPGRAVVLAEGHRGDWFEDIGGVSIYLVPPGRQRISPYYSSLALAKTTRWDEMLTAYHGQCA